eukprot:COSAG02_NODE_3202_length_7181_cov_25.177210_2_plen_101_part_00
MRNTHSSVTKVVSTVQLYVFVAELCVLRTFGGLDFLLFFICAQSVSEFLWDRLRASIQFHVMPKRTQYARFSGESVVDLISDYNLVFMGEERACGPSDLP